MPGDREMSTTLVAANNAVAANPAIGVNREARIVAMITPTGAKNGTIERTENSPLVRFASHQGGLPTVSAEIAKTSNEPAINTCVTITAIFQLGVSEPACSVCAGLGGGRDDIARPTIA